MFSSKLFLQIVLTVSLVMVTSASAQSVTVIEYYNQVLDAHFITGRSDEQAALNTVADFKRTGMTFQATAAATASPSQTKICRFYISIASPYVSSHFYGRQGIDCESIRSQNLAGFTWEDYDFATQQPTSGTCPAGTVTIFRGFRAAAGGKTSNHRYSVSAATYASAASAGYVGEGAAFCVTAATDVSGPTATAVGVATGTTTSNSTIGPAGGSVTSTDGKMLLSIPAGALVSNTTIGIQAISNKAHGKVGGAYRLTPDGQSFLKPVTLTFTYSEADLDGTAPQFLGAAFQTVGGFWKWLGVATVNTANKIVSVNTSHFTDFSTVKGLQIRPPKKTIKPSATVALEVRACYERIDEELVDLNTGLGYDCDNDQGPSTALTVDQWSVNGREGGGGVFGSVSGSGWSGTYVAPANAPTPPTVAVSARVIVRGISGSDLVVSNITIAQDSWTGTATATSPAQTVNAEVIWTLDSTVNKVSTYSPSGTISVSGGIFVTCTVNPANWVIEPGNGILTIDDNTNPPTYFGGGTSSWPASLTCPPNPQSFPTTVTGFYLGGGGGPTGLAAAGSVSGGGTTIEGTDSVAGGVVFRWKFTRN